MPADPIINGARRFTLEETQTVVQMDTLAKALGGMVNLSMVFFPLRKVYVTKRKANRTHSCACQLAYPRLAMMVG